MAQEVGLQGMTKMFGQTFGKVTFKRKDKVVTLASLVSSVKVANKRVVIDPLTIFQRVCIMKQSDEELKEHFKYELAPFPMSLFNEQGMRKGTKSSFYSAFSSFSSNIPNDSNTFVVVDGGYLLHKFVWHRNSSMRTIVSGYVHYVEKHFGINVAVVFDGYPEEAANRSTKSAERMRRSAAQSCSDILFEESTIIQVPQEKLLANENNKRRLITLLRDAFEQQGVAVKVSEEDADRDIIQEALSRSPLHERVLVIGEDVDLLVLLNGLGSDKSNVYFQKSDKREAGCVHYSTTSFTAEATEYPPGIVLFIHAFSGCDTTSAPFWQGKTKFLSVLQKKPHLMELAAVFLQPKSNHQAIANAGEKCFVALYGGDEGNGKLNSLRYDMFVKSAMSRKANLARLPPTEEAARQHSFRTYHQVQKWLGANKNPTDWGWQLDKQGLIPTPTNMDPASQQLLKVLSCKCKKGCAGGCTCRKTGLKCSPLCKFCVGKSCVNLPRVLIEESDESEENDQSPIIVAQDEELQLSLRPRSLDEDLGVPGPSKQRRLL